MISYDEACKQVLANKIILAWILKACVREYNDYSVEEIADKYIEGEPEVSKTAVHVDETAEFITGMNTESATMKEGTVTFDIKFRTILPETEEAIRGNVTEKAANYDLITVVMVCLGGKNKENYDGLLKMLDVLLSEETEPADKKRTLQEEFGIAMTKKLEGDVMRMCNLSKGVYERAVDKTLVDTIKNLLESTDWDIDKCMDNMKIPNEKREAYKAAVYGELVSA